MSTLNPERVFLTPSLALLREVLAEEKLCFLLNGVQVVEMRSLPSAAEVTMPVMQDKPKPNRGPQRKGRWWER